MQASAAINAAILPQAKQTPVPEIIEQSLHNSVIWPEALKIVKEKLGNNNAQLDLIKLTSQSAEENIEAVIRGLNNLQVDDKKRRWRYTWHGREIIIVERLGKILKTMEKYSTAVDIAIRSHPQVAALVWASIWGIMQVCI